ncbi:MAG: chemotaxis protein CheW [Alphaproteobacteria bacterium]|nr:chemotaxis protein CheW [Alphaproteobacteria bacterium]
MMTGIEDLGDLLGDFLTETTENIAVIDQELVDLERNPNDRDILSGIFRLMHTIKGTCGFLGLPRLEKLAHATEGVLDKFRGGQLEVTQEAVSAIFGSIDKIKEIIAIISESKAEPGGDDSDLIARLHALSEGAVEKVAAVGVIPIELEVAQEQPAIVAAPAAAKVVEVAQVQPAVAVPVAAPATAPEEESFPVAAELLAEVEAAVAGGKKAASDTDIAAEMQAESAPAAPPKPAVAVEMPAVAAAPVVAAAPATVPEEESFPVAAELLAEVEAAVAGGKKAASDMDIAAEMQAESAKVAPKSAAAAAAKPAAAEVAQPAATAAVNKEEATTLRVNVDVLEDLMTLVSELVLTRNQLMQLVRSGAAGGANATLTTPLQRLSNITTDLQEGVMKTRMQPIGNAWSKLPRIVRDLAAEQQKKIELIMQGSETELDRQVLELVKDPLIHMVRNSADHGLESAEERIKAGKPETGRIVLNAFHEGGHIVIQITDDGRGLNYERIREKILMNGLASDTDLQNMTDQQVGMFIFKPGFSTASKVTSVSGRGVGMDVVRSNVDKIGGVIDMKSVQGKGSVFTIKIPLTLAIVSALIVSAGNQRFAMPQISVLELVRVTKGSEYKIDNINDSLVMRLRGKLLPLVNLAKLLELPYQEPTEDDDVFVIVSQVGNFTFGTMVQQVFDTEEIVVKPVAPILRGITLFSGNTILGDGSVIMILDPNGIAERMGDADKRQVDDDVGHQAGDMATSSDSTSILIFKGGGDDVPKAVQLGLIARLEELDVKTIELSGGRPVVQYRGSLMPLIAMNQGFTLPEKGRQPVLVFTDNDRSMGLMVDDILDTVNDRLNIQVSSEKPGVVGTAVIQGQAMDVLDAGHYLTQAFGDWFETQTKDSAGNICSMRLLMVDDSAFFRNLLTPILAAAGFEVMAVPSAVEALARRDEGESYDLIISDIDMPGMNGLEFAQTIRREGPWKDLPLIALSSHAKAEDIAKGKAAGFDEYIPKFDRDQIVLTVKQALDKYNVKDRTGT